MVSKMRTLVGALLLTAGIAFGQTVVVPTPGGSTGGAPTANPAHGANNYAGADDLATANTAIGTINATLPTLAPIAAPVFTTSATAPIMNATTIPAIFASPNNPISYSNLGYQVNGINVVMPVINLGGGVLLMGVAAIGPSGTVLNVDAFPSGGCPVGFPGATTAFDCAASYAVLRDNTASVPCTPWILQVSTNYSSNLAFNDPGNCSGIANGNYGVSIIGVAPDASIIQVTSCGSQQFWWQHANSTYLSSARPENLMVKGQGLNTKCGSFGFSGMEHMNPKNVHSYKFAHQPSDGGITSGSNGAWQAAEIQIGGAGGSTFENDFTNMKVEDLGTLYPAVTDPSSITFGSWTEAKPSAYSGATETWANGVTAINLSLHCGVEGYLWGNGTTACQGKQKTPTLQHVTHYIDGSSLSSSTYSIGTVYDYVPKILLKGGNGWETDPIDARFSTVPNTDPLWVRSPVAMATTHILKASRSACAMDPTVTPNVYAVFDTSGNWISDKLDPVNPVTIWPLITAFSPSGTVSVSSIAFGGTNLTIPNSYTGATADNPSVAPYGFTISLIGKTQPGTPWTCTPTINSSGVMTACTFSSGTATGYSTSTNATLSTQINILNSGGTVARTFMSHGEGGDCPANLRVDFIDMNPADESFYIASTDSTSHELVTQQGAYFGAYFANSIDQDHSHFYNSWIGQYTSGGQISKYEDDSNYFAGGEISGTGYLTENGSTHTLNYAETTASGIYSGSFSLPTPDFWSGKVDWIQDFVGFNALGGIKSQTILKDDNFSNQELQGDHHFLRAFSGPADIGPASPSTGSDLFNFDSTQSQIGADNLAPFNFHGPLFTTNALSPHPTVVLAPAVVGTAYSASFTYSGLTCPCWYHAPFGFPINVANGQLSPSIPSSTYGLNGSDAAGTYQATGSAAFNIVGTPTTPIPYPGEGIITVRDNASHVINLKYVMPYVQGGPVTVTGTGVTGTFPSLSLPFTQGTQANIPLTPSCTTCTVNAGPFSWKVTSGTLPPGISLLGNGVFYGTPTAPGTYNYQVTVQDPSAVQGNSNGSLSVITFTSTVAAGTIATNTGCATGAKCVTGSTVSNVVSSGFLTVAASATTSTVTDQLVTPTSKIQVTFNSGLSTALGITCNTTPTLPSVSNQVAGSFTVTTTAPATYADCFNYTVTN